MGAALHLGCKRAWVQLGSVQIPQEQHGDGQEQGRGVCVHVLLRCVRTQRQEWFPCAGKLNLLAEGRPCLLSSQQTEQ